MLTYIIIGIITAILNVSHALERGAWETNPDRRTALLYAIAIPFVVILWPIGVGIHAVTIIEEFT